MFVEEEKIQSTLRRKLTKEVLSEVFLVLCSLESDGTVPRQRHLGARNDSVSMERKSCQDKWQREGRLMSNWKKQPILNQVIQDFTMF